VINSEGTESAEVAEEPAEKRRRQESPGNEEESRSERVADARRSLRQEMDRQREDSKR
jgi:hypothetical protein